MNNNIQTVFEFIKTKCANYEDGERNDCYRELSNMLNAKLGAGSVLTYVNKLAVEGVIKFDAFSKNIVLTRKGRIMQPTELQAAA